MRQQCSMWMLLAAATAFIGILQPLRAEVIEKTKQADGTTIHYKVVLPSGYDPARAYPAILAFGGGPQTMNTVDNILNRIQLQEDAYRKDNKMPARLFEVYEEQKAGLQALKSKHGPIVKPDLL